MTPVNGCSSQVVDRPGGGGGKARELCDGRRIMPISTLCELLRAVGTQHGRAYRPERQANAVVLLVDLKADTRDGNHHGVAPPDLREGSGTRHRLPLHAGDELVGSEARELRSAQELAQRIRRLPVRAAAATTSA